MSANNDAAAHTWNALPVDHPMATLARRRVIGKQAMISHVTLEAGCFVPTHAHENEQFVCVLSGRMRFRLGSERSERREVIVAGGDVLHLPANVPHEAEALELSVVIDVFSPPSATTGIDNVRVRASWPAARSLTGDDRARSVPRR